MTSRLSATSPAVTSASTPQPRVDSESVSTVSISSPTLLVLFSRREVHIFDLRHLMFSDAGWRFPLDAFPAAAPVPGQSRRFLGWPSRKLFLATVLSRTYSAGKDYQQVHFSASAKADRGNSICGPRRSGVSGRLVPESTDRDELLREMCEEARRSLLFLKSLRRVVFGEIVEKRFSEWACVEATRQPPSEMVRFAKSCGRNERQGGATSAGRMFVPMRCFGARKQ